MVEYQQALDAVRRILAQFPEVKQLIKLELNSQGTENVEFHENKPSQIPHPQDHGTVSTNSTESSGEVPHESGSGNVSTGCPTERTDRIAS